MHCGAQIRPILKKESPAGRKGKKPSTAILLLWREATGFFATSWISKTNPGVDYSGSSPGGFCPGGQSFQLGLEARLLKVSDLMSKRLSEIPDGRRSNSTGAFLHEGTTEEEEHSFVTRYCGVVKDLGQIPTRSPQWNCETTGVRCAFSQKVVNGGARDKRWRGRRWSAAFAQKPPDIRKGRCHRSEPRTVGQPGGGTKFWETDQEGGPILYNGKRDCGLVNSTCC